jgi:hypothetical protein
MTQDSKLKDLKTVAKKIARSKRIDHHEALDLVATELGYAHWYALSAINKNGWLPSSEDMAKATNFLKKVNPGAVPNDEEADEVFEVFGNPGGEIQGQIGPHPYQVGVSMDDVYMSGRGWLILVPEAPSKKPNFEVTDKRYEANPILDPDFVSQALEIANAKAEQVRARIASDWPRRSTKPDAQGRAVHPINGGLSDKWYCLHCDEQSSGKAVAGNLWHCPSCSASPIDIFSSPWTCPPKVPIHGSCRQSDGCTWNRCEDDCQNYQRNDHGWAPKPGCVNSGLQRNSVKLIGHVKAFPQKSGTHDQDTSYQYGQKTFDCVSLF